MLRGVFATVMTDEFFTIPTEQCASTSIVVTTSQFKLTY